MFCQTFGFPCCSQGTEPNRCVKAVRQLVGFDFRCGIPGEGRYNGVGKLKRGSTIPKELTMTIPYVYLNHKSQLNRVVSQNKIVLWLSGGQSTLP